jgi:flagellar biosynthesis/type III secretory pathway protein FliH
MVECRENFYRRLILLNVLVAYQQLDKEQEREYQQLLLTERYKEIGPMQLTVFEQAMQEGLQRGLQQGEVKGLRQAVQLQLEHRFGSLSPAVVQRLDALSAERLQELLLAILHAPSLADLGLEK